MTYSILESCSGLGRAVARLDPTLPRDRVFLCLESGEGSCVLHDGCSDYQDGEADYEFEVVGDAWKEGLRRIDPPYY